MWIRPLIPTAAFVLALVLSAPALAQGDDDSTTPAFLASPATGDVTVEGAPRRAIPALRIPPRAGVMYDGDVDTLWVGHRAGQTGNYWEVGVGPARAGTGNDDGLWTFDSPVHGDSLQGWWPTRFAHTNSSGPIRTDENRPWWAIENGNQANYVIPQGRFDASKLGTAWPGNRTFGVVGVWHGDPGNGTPGTGVNWAPLAGSRSAWMGMRRHGDLTAIDPVTGNPFNADLLQFNGSALNGSTTNKLLPGYGQQMDQMLYRDIDLSAAPADSGVRITFRYRTQMSTGHGTTQATRTGWFEGDPLTVNTVTPGNFISAEAGTPTNSQAPVDSFQVYVGAPVEGTWKASDNLVRPIYDPLRRWFNEVLRRDARAWKFGRAGADSGQVTVVVSKAEKDAFIAASGSSSLRVVFRVHTNVGTSDESGLATYTSNGRGAAQVDDVVVDAGSGPSTLGDFEGGDLSKDIDNLQPASAAWRSTGKPPTPFSHVHALASLTWQDVWCGSPGSSSCACDMGGAVVSMGDHDNGEAAGTAPLTADANGNFVISTPTICLESSPGVNNGWDLTQEEATGTADYVLSYDVYAGVLDIFNQGNAWILAIQAYPVLQADGTPSWSDQITPYPPGLLWDSATICTRHTESLKLGMSTSNASGVPDSVRVSIRRVQQTYRFGVSVTQSTDGAYFDNIAFGIVDGPTSPISVSIWDWFQDAFPFNETAGLPGTAAFDTTSALVVSGLNIAQATRNQYRYDVPGDTIVANAAGSDVRMELVFRIKPGPGNYVTVGTASSGLRRVPTATAAVSPGDGSWWGTWRALPGEFATPGGSALHAAWPGGWNPNVWMSARCDTAQINLFPVEAAGVNAQIDPARWMSAYHESDPHLAILGIPHHECFLIDTLGPADATNITCASVPAWVLADPARAGYDSDPITVEGTKVIPDGLLTPGSHVEYFWRRSDATSPAVTTAMCPDTNVVWPQPGEASLDAHRWQQFGVLPDRWKSGDFTPGSAMACALVVDLADRRGEELAWVSIADSIGATAAGRRGAHNGWGGVPGGASLNTPAYYVRSHGGQPGSTWDFYQVKAGEDPLRRSGSLGGRLGYTDPSPLNRVHGKYARIAPTPEMLDVYYKVIVLLSGDLSVGVIGPLDDQSADEVTLLQNWLLGATLGAPRGIGILGDGFAESAWNTSLEQEVFLTDYLGFDFYFQSYRSLAANFDEVVDLRQSPDVNYLQCVYGALSPCTATLDVLILNPAVAEAHTMVEYESVGATSFPAGVIKPATAARPWVAATNGLGIQRITSQFGYEARWRMSYLYWELHQFGAFCSSTAIPIWPPGCNWTWSGGVPETPGIALSNFARLANNPMRSGFTSVEFGLLAADRVEVRVLDVAGRIVRTLADQRYEAGTHRLVWDGRDDDGRELAAGVYFARVRFASRGFESVKHVIVLR